MLNDKYTCEWYTENRVILVRAYNWTADDLRQTADDVNAMIAQTPSKDSLVHVIWDFSKLDEYPKNIPQISAAVRKLFTNKRLGWALSITDHSLVKFLADIATSLYGVRYRNFNTFEEATDFLGGLPSEDRK